MAKKMVSMKLTEADRKKREKSYEVIGEQPEYPYGLNIHLDNIAIEKLGIKDLPKLGEKIMLMAQVEVTGANLRKEKSGDKKDMSLQITELCLVEEEKESKAKKMYDGETE